MSVEQYIPISSVADSNGAILALQGLIAGSSENQAMITPPAAPGLDALNVLQVSSFQASASVMLSLGFRGFAMAATADATFYVLDVMYFTSQPSTSGGPIAEWYYGIGYRVGVQGFNASGTAAASIGGLAASATASGTATAYQIQTIGINFANVMPLLLPLAGQLVGGLNLGTYQQLGVVTQALADYRKTPGAAVSPQLIGYTLGTSLPQLPTTAASLGFGLRALAKGLCYNDASTQTPSHGVTVVATQFQPLYAEILGTGDGSVVPSAAQQQQAKELLALLP